MSSTEAIERKISELLRKGSCEATGNRDATSVIAEAVEASYQVTSTVVDLMMSQGKVEIEYGATTDQVDVPLLIRWRREFDDKKPAELKGPTKAQRRRSGPVTKAKISEDERRKNGLPACVELGRRVNEEILVRLARLGGIQLRILDAFMAQLNSGFEAVKLERKRARKPLTHDELLGAIRKGLQREGLPDGDGPVEKVRRALVRLELIEGSVREYGGAKTWDWVAVNYSIDKLDALYALMASKLKKARPRKKAGTKQTRGKVSVAQIAAFIETGACRWQDRHFPLRTELRRAGLKEAELNRSLKFLRVMGILQYTPMGPGPGKSFVDLDAAEERGKRLIANIREAEVANVAEVGEETEAAETDMQQEVAGKAEPGSDDGPSTVATVLGTTAVGATTQAGSVLERVKAVRDELVEAQQLAAHLQEENARLNDEVSRLMSAQKVLAEENEALRGELAAIQRELGSG